MNAVMPDTVVSYESDIRFGAVLFDKGAENVLACPGHTTSSLDYYSMLFNFKLCR